MRRNKNIIYLRDWEESKRLENVSCLSAEFTMLFFKELNPNKKEHKKIFFKAKNGIHYFEFKARHEGIKSRWRRMKRISEQENFVGWIPATEKMSRRLKLKMLNEKNG